MYRGVPLNCDDPIGDHWLGDHDHHSMPCLADGSSFVNLVSVRVSVLPELAAGVSRERLYFPWRFESDWGMGTSFIRYSGDLMELLTDPEAKSYRIDSPLPARGLRVMPLDETEAEEAEPRIIIGGHPVGGFFGTSFPMRCCACSGPMSFVLQVQSRYRTLGFSVWDGETLYYGWCDRCGILGVEAHTS